MYWLDEEKCDYKQAINLEMLLYCAIKIAKNYKL